MRRFQRVGDLAGVVERGLQQKWSLDRFAVHQLHDQRSIFDAVNLGDIGMVQRSQHLGFALEAGQPFGILRQSGGKNLDGYFAIELLVPRAIHFAHSARADGCKDFVGSQTSPSGKGHGC